MKRFQDDPLSVGTSLLVGLIMLGWLVPQLSVSEPMQWFPCFLIKAEGTLIPTADNTYDLGNL